MMDGIAGCDEMNCALLHYRRKGTLSPFLGIQSQSTPLLDALGYAVSNNGRMMSLVCPPWVRSLRLSLALVAMVGFVALAGAGCGRDANDGMSAARTNSLPTKAPWAFPRGTTEAAIITNYRNHLHQAALDQPQAQVLAHIFFRAFVPLGDVATLFGIYQLRGGPSASVQISSPRNGIAGIQLPASASDPASFQNAVLTQSALIPDPFSGEVSKEPPSIGSINAWTSIEQLDKLWTEHTDIVRGIAILGTDSTLVPVWRSFKPGDPLVAGMATSEAP